MPDQAAHIRELFEAYMRGTATTTERSELAEALDEYDQEEMLDIMSGIAADTSPDPAFSQGEWEGVINDILSRRTGSTRAIPWLKPRRWWAAAAVLIIAAMTMTMVTLLHHRDQQPQIAAQPKQDLPPGGNRATLTLAGGQTIILDSAHTGALAQQGTTRIIKRDSGSLSYQSTQQAAADPVQYNILTTPRGGQYQVILPDGTKVWLNAASSIRYPTAFSGRERKVEITGEAYFEVTKNAAMPFRVMAAGRTIEVLGTHFNINAYPDEPMMRTTLLEGSVKILGVILHPGEQAVVGNNERVSITKDPDLEEATAWKNGQFQFTRMDEESIMRQVARWYDVEVSYEGRPSPRSFSGIVSRSSPLSQVMQIMEQANIKFRIEGKKIILIQ